MTSTPAQAKTLSPTTVGLGLVGVGLLLIGVATRRTKARVSRFTTGVGAAMLGVTALAVARAGGPARTRVARRVRKAVTVSATPERLYRFWRELQNLPFLVERLESVEVLDPTRSRWRVNGPLGRTLEWEARIVEDRENELIRWASLEGSQITVRGEVRFRPAPYGTEISVEVEHVPPAGDLGLEVERGLHRLKQIMEVGEVVHPGRHAARPQHPHA